MGSMVTLSLNDIPIDYGKNHSWAGHAWLFPPGSLRCIDYIYAGNCRERKPGLEVSMGTVRSRMDHLGYSLSETRDRFDAELVRWNRTNDLELAFDWFLDVVTSIDFTTITDQNQEDFGYDIRELLLRLLDPQGERHDFDVGGQWSLEDFIMERLETHVLVRCLAEREPNCDLQLAWGYQDLVENGWEAVETLMSIDRPSYIFNHIKLYGRLQDHSGQYSLADFDRWLVGQGLPDSTPYVRVGPKGPRPPVTDTLPTVVRNIIHHPENRNQVLTDSQLGEALEQLLQVAQNLSPPMSM